MNSMAASVRTCDDRCYFSIRSSMFSTVILKEAVFVVIISIM